MDAPTQATQQHAEAGRDALASDNARCSATEEEFASCNVTSAPTISAPGNAQKPRIGCGNGTAGYHRDHRRQAISSINGRAKMILDDVGRRLESSTPPATAQNATAAMQVTSTPPVPSQALIDAGVDLLKEIQKRRERWVDRTDKTVGTLKAHYEMFRIALTEAQSDLLQSTSINLNGFMQREWHSSPQWRTVCWNRQRFVFDCSASRS